MRDWEKNKMWPTSMKLERNKNEWQTEEWLNIWSHISWCRCMVIIYCTNIYSYVCHYSSIKKYICHLDLGHYLDPKADSIWNVLLLWINYTIPTHFLTNMASVYPSYKWIISNNNYWTHLHLLGLRWFILEIRHCEFSLNPGVYPFESYILEVRIPPSPCCTSGQHRNMSIYLY